MIARYGQNALAGQSQFNAAYAHWQAGLASVPDSDHRECRAQVLQEYQAASESSHLRAAEAMGIISNFFVLLALTASQALISVVARGELEN